MGEIPQETLPPDTSGMEASLEAISTKLDTVIELLTAMSTVVVDMKHWLMLLFFVSSIGFGISIGYLVGKR